MMMLILLDEPQRELIYNSNLSYFSTYQAGNIAYFKAFTLIYVLLEDLLHTYVSLNIKFHVQIIFQRLV